MNRQLIDQLKSNVVDLVVGRMDDPPVMEGLWFESLGTDTLAFAVRQGHPLVGVRKSVLRECLRWPMIVPATASIPRHNLESLLSRNGHCIPSNCIETSDAYLGRLLTRESDAVWIAPMSAIRRAAGADMLSLLPISTVGVEEPLGILRHRDRALAPVVDALTSQIRAAAQKWFRIDDAESNGSLLIPAELTKARKVGTHHSNPGLSLA